MSKNCNPVIWEVEIKMGKRFVPTTDLEDAKIKLKHLQTSYPSITYRLAKYRRIK